MRHLSSCLHASLFSVVTHIDKLTYIEEQLHHLLPSQLREVAVVSGYQQGCLTIGVSDAVWLTTLRYELPALRDQLRQKTGLHGLTSIKLKVQPSISTLKQKKPSTKPELSFVASEALRTLHELVEQKP